jgi:hypothetical protein
MIKLRINDTQLRTDTDYGPWNNSAVLYAKWVFSTREHKLYENNDQQRWVIWRPTPETQHYRTRLSASLFTRSAHSITQLPDDVRLASVHCSNNRTVSLISLGDYHHKIDTATTDHSRHPINPSYCGVDGIFQYNIIMNNGRIYTDGSYAHGISTYAWAAQPPYFDVPLTSVNYDSFQWQSDFVHGPTEEQHSYRAELGGILAAINYTNTICRRANITQGTCTLICDNKGALCAAFSTKRPTP